MGDKLIKIEGENRLTFDTVVRTVAKLLGENDEKKVLKMVMEALKKDYVIMTLCGEILSNKGE